MAATSPPNKKKTRDVYDEEFALNLEIAKNLTEKLPSNTDKAICKKWITKMLALKTNDVAVKRNRNDFFKYFLQVLHKGVEGAEDDDQSDLDAQQKTGDEETRNFTCRWSEDKRTYIAAKPLPGRGTLVYMAVSKDPSLGWDLDGTTVVV